MCRLHKRRGHALDWRELRERIEDGSTDSSGSAEVDIDLTIDPESGGVVVDHPEVDIVLED